MGSILNFIFPYNKDNVPSWFINGPLTCHIQQKLNHTYNFEFNDKCKNYIVFETENKFLGFIENLNFNIQDNKTILNLLIENKNTGIIICSIADPATLKEKTHIIEVLSSIGLLERVFFVESNFQHKNHKNTFCWNFFLETFSEDNNQIYLKFENDLGYLSEIINENELDTFRNKKFLCFNRNLDRQHRISLLYDYLNHNFSDSLFSFLSYQSHYSSIYQFKPNEFDTTYFHKFLPIELDTHKVKDKSSFKTGDAIGKKDFYLDTCIHIVTETSFDDNELFFSEKIVKPLINFQPFIVLGPHMYLNELKKYGFKTFSDFWDESYDEIENPKERYDSVMKTIFNLNSKSIEELNELYQKTKEICIHNKKQFYNIRFTINNFLEKL
jgi:hypothetical protein